MARFKLTDDALMDLREIKDYSLAKFGRAMTADYLRGMQKILQRLAENPGMGSDETAALLPGVSSFPWLSHRIYYFASKAEITIIGIVHQSRLPAILQNRM